MLRKQQFAACLPANHLVTQRPQCLEMVPQERIELPTHALRNLGSLARLMSINTLPRLHAVQVVKTLWKSVCVGTKVATVPGPALFMVEAQMAITKGTPPVGGFDNHG
jgi:hypothetical protein